MNGIEINYLSDGEQYNPSSLKWLLTGKASAPHERDYYTLSESEIDFYLF